MLSMQFEEIEQSVYSCTRTGICITAMDFSINDPIAYLTSFALYIQSQYFFIL